MADVIKELTGNETVEELELFFAEKGLDVTDTKEDAELSEEELDLVAGGMGYIQACLVTAKSYYEIKKYGKIKSYSTKTVKEALKKTDAVMNTIGKVAAGIIGNYLGIKF